MYPSKRSVMSVKARNVVKALLRTIKLITMLKSKCEMLQLQKVVLFSGIRRFFQLFTFQSFSALAHIVC